MRARSRDRFIFALIDSDGDGTVSLQDFKPLTKKSSRRWIPTKMAPFPRRDQTFMRGTGKSAPKEHEKKKNTNSSRNR